MSRRRVTAVAVAASALLAFASAAHLRAPGETSEAARPLAFSPAASRPSDQGLQAAATTAWGGRYTVASGETVEVLASDAYAQEESLTRGWAEYLARLVHGSELSSLTLFVAPPDEVEELCGRDALACYSPRRSTIVAPGNDPDEGVSAQAIVAHEYGHHVAANRSNAPWAAVDWGTKRWASYVNVCERTAAGELHPGDDDRFYGVNPGEGFAEVYRVLNEVRGVAPTLGWNIVDDRFMPDAAALAAVEQDVAAPWTGNRSSTTSGRLRARGARTYPFATPFDGMLTVSLRVPAAATFRLELVDARTSRSRGRATATLRGPARVSTTVCGQRSFRARVTALRGAGSYRLTVSKP